MDKKVILTSFLCLSLLGCSMPKENVKETRIEEKEMQYSTLYEDTSEDSHALLVEDEQTLENIEVQKSGNSASRDEADFYGYNAAILAQNGGKLTLSNSLIETNGEHANAIFAYGENSEIHVSNSTIHTKNNNSGGIMVTGGANLFANNLTVTTKGGSSAAIRSDRGGGNMVIENGSYSSYGQGSPAIYSTANVNVSNAQLYSDISQAVVVEGANSVTLNNCDATGKNTFQNSDNSTYLQAVMLYQSMSGDAEQGASTFTMKDGSLTSLNEGMFFVTNTVANINLENVSMQYASDDFLRICSAGWGTDGQNGGQVTMNTSSQSIKGNILVDSISNLNLYMDDNSSFEGSIQSEGEVYVELTNGSTWKLTEDSSITSLTCETDSIDLNGHTLIVNGENYEEGSASFGKAIEVTVYENTGIPSPPPGDRPELPPGENGEMPPAPPEGFDPNQEPPKKPE